MPTPLQRRWPLWNYAKRRGNPATKDGGLADCVSVSFCDVGVAHAGGHSWQEKRSRGSAGAEESSGSIVLSSVISRISRTPTGPRGPRLRPGYYGQAEALKRLPARSPPKARGALPQSTQFSV
jgi:hypothetical protein